MKKNRWTEVCKHVSYTVDDDKVWVKGEPTNEVKEAGVADNVYAVLPPELSRMLMEVRVHDCELFEAAIELMGHTMLTFQSLAFGAVQLALISPQDIAIISGLMNSTAFTGLHTTMTVLEASARTDEERRRITDEQERLRKLLGE